MNANAINKDIIPSVKNRTNFWGEKTIVGSEKKANRMKRAPTPRAINAFV